MVNLVALIAFWKRKETSQAPEPKRIIPLPAIASASLEGSRSTSEESANHARESLKVLRLERQILGTALTTIYESHSKGLISESERDRLLEKYKVDLTGLEKSIAENQRTVDLYDLESERDELARNFKTKLDEIDTMIWTLKSGGSINRPRKTSQDDKKPDPKRNEANKAQSSQEPQPQRTSESEQQQITDAEKRVEQIRAEILQAMDRLEQIESEG